MGNIRIFTDEELNKRNDGLKIIKSVMDELNIEFFLIMGILLGAIREKNFIKWDWDVELGFFTYTIINRIDEIKDSFEESSFIVEIIDNSYDNLKINLFYNDNKFTLWGLYKKGDWLQRSSYKLPAKHFDKLDYINFLGVIYRIPNNVEELLTFIYGDWKIPKITTTKEEYLSNEIFNYTPIQRIKRYIKNIIKKT